MKTKKKLGKLSVTVMLLLGGFAAYSQPAGETTQKDTLHNQIRNVAMVRTEMEVDTSLFRERMPEYPGGVEMLMKYIACIKYPEKARMNDWKGTVYIKFIIDTTGQPIDFSIERSCGHPILDDAALKHMMKMPKWTPAYQMDKPVRVEYVWPIKFKLS